MGEWVRGISLGVTLVGVGLTSSFASASTSPPPLASPPPPPPADADAGMKKAENNMEKCLWCKQTQKQKWCKS